MIETSMFKAWPKICGNLGKFRENLCSHDNFRLGYYVSIEATFFCICFVYEMASEVTKKMIKIRFEGSFSVSAD